MTETQWDESNAAKPADLEKMAEQTRDDEVEAGSTKSVGVKGFLGKILSVSPVEARGVMPVPLEERTSTRYSSYFSIWFCMNVNLLP
jgi:hypothetical protein